MAAQDHKSRIPPRCDVTYKGQLHYRLAEEQAEQYTKEHKNTDGSFMLAIRIMSHKGNRTRRSALYLYVPIKQAEQAGESS